MILMLSNYFFILKMLFILVIKAFAITSVPQNHSAIILICWINAQETLSIATVLQTCHFKYKYKLQTISVDANIMV